MAPRSARTLLLLTLLAALLTWPSCGDGDRGIGSECGDDSDCDDICASGPHFPGGVCTLLCLDDGDCPRGWVCIDRDGGICLEQCSETDRCQELYDTRWSCRVTSKRPSGKASVCIGD